MPNTATTTREAEWNWPVVGGLAFVHAVALVGTPLYIAFVEISFMALGMAFLVLLVRWFLGGLGITIGYHRMFTHRAWDAIKSVKYTLLILGAIGLQKEIKWWGVRHLEHHAYADTDKDPHNINKGFWWAHMGWLLKRRLLSEQALRMVKRLEKDPLIQWQDRYYILLAIGLGFVMPLALGFLWGAPVLTLLVGGFLGAVVLWHATWLINSAAHRFGTRPTGSKGTARNNFMIALVTLGEGWHAYHHEDPRGWRMGRKWYEIDIGSYVIILLVKLGLAWIPERRTSPT